MDVVQTKVLLVNLDSSYSEGLKALLAQKVGRVEVIPEGRLLQEYAAGPQVIVVAGSVQAYWLAAVAKFQVPIFLLGDLNVDAHCWASVESLAMHFPVAVLAQKILNAASCTAFRSASETEQVLHERVTHLQSELEKTISVRDDFLSMASHELRTPLNGLILDTQLRKLQLLKGNMAAFTEARIKQMIERDEHQLLAMVRLVDDMLDSSRIRTGQLSISVHAVDLVELVTQVVEGFALRFELAECPLKTVLGRSIEGCWDGFRIEQIISNLLTNALRYGLGQAVEVSVWQENRLACVSVKDHGVGIDGRDRRRIFGEFERVVTHNFTPGLGLGLFVSEQIAKAHGGRIELDSDLGQGSTFTLKLPL